MSIRKNIFILIAFTIHVVFGTFIIRDELPKYTKIATTVDGYPCLGGCSPITRECVTNWLWIKKPCEIENRAAPIFFTSQVRDKDNSQCWSNCGKFGHIYDWCVTSAANNWDYCSSQVRGTSPLSGRGFIDTYTSISTICESPCENESKSGYSCYYKGKILKQAWAHCAKPAISRVPILPPDFNVGVSNKRNCEAFVTNLIKDKENMSRFDTEFAADNYIYEVAGDIETAVKSAPNTGVYVIKTSDTDPVKSYTLIDIVLGNGSNVLVPAIIRATVTNKTIRKFENLIDLRSSFGDEDENFNWRIIGYEIGGSSESYNFVPQSSRFTESWSLVEKAIKRWTIDTNGSVDMIVVVFYGDEHSMNPKAFGVALSFNNPDGIAFVSCKDTIYWNN